jgi:hypothetical protein
VTGSLGSCLLFFELLQALFKIPLWFQTQKRIGIPSFPRVSLTKPVSRYHTGSHCQLVVPATVRFDIETPSPSLAWRRIAPFHRFCIPSWKMPIPASSRGWQVGLHLLVSRYRYRYSNGGGGSSVDGDANVLDTHSPTR